MPSANLSRRSLIILGIGFLVLFVGGGSRFAIGLVLKPMVEELDWTRGVVGGAAAVFLVISSICMFVSGRLADRVSLRLLLGGGLLISAIGSAAMSLVQAPWQAMVFYGVIFAAGNGLASITPIGVLVSRWFPGRIGLANAIAVSGTGLGQLLIIGGLTAALSDTGWRLSFVVLGVINLSMIPLVIAGMRPKRNAASAEDTSAQRHPGIRLGAAMRKPRLWVLLAVYAVCGFQDFFFATHIVAFALDTGVKPLVAGNLLALMGLTGVAGVLLSGLWSDHSGPLQATFACFVLRIAIFSVLLVNQDAISVIAAALIFGITFWITAPLTVVFVRDAFGTAHLGAISGMIVMIHHMCGGLGAWLGAISFDRSGSYDGSFAVMLALSVLAAGLCAGLRMKVQHATQ